MRLQGLHYETRDPIEVAIEAGRIVAVRLAPPAPDLPIIAPGLIDVQINGFGGHDFNDPKCDLDRLVQAIWASGTGRFCPTLVTAPPEDTLACARAIGRACARSRALAAAIVGVHLEGPALSPEDGPRGAHPRAWIRPLTWEEFQRLHDATGGRVRIVTLAPESPGALPLIERLTAAGILVAIGHTAATPAQIQDAVRAGARLSTHLGNGAHPVLPRHPNYIWEQLACDALWASAIPDGHHLPASVLRVFARVKGERLVLVSDAVRLAGLPPGRYEDRIGGGVQLTEDGRLHTLADARILAGAARSLCEGIAWASQAGALSFAEAIAAAALAPAALLGLPSGLRPGAPADLLLWHGSQRRALLGGEWLPSDPAA